MTATVAVVCALLGVPAGIFANLLIERVPDRQSLKPVPPVATLTDSRLDRLVIVATVVLFGASGLRFGADWAVPAYLVIFLGLVAISVIDTQVQIVPNWIVYPTGFISVPLFALAALFSGDWDDFGQAMLGATLAFVALLVLHIIQPHSMGFGDVRRSFVLGLFLGWINLSHVLTGLFLGVLLIALTGLVLAALRLASVRDHIAFGPFMALGATITVFFGEPIIRWWTGA